MNTNVCCVKRSVCVCVVVVVSVFQVNLDFNDDDENRVLLLVHDTKPPFLQGQVLSGKTTGVVLPLKDSTSDMAVIAR